MTYRQAIGYLNSFIDFERLPEPRLKTTPEDIERFRRLLGELNDPHLKYPVVHIAGTKGKGSTAALLTSILHAAGYRVGLYTSPHLISVRERIAVAGRMIAKSELARLISRIRLHFGDLQPDEPLAFRTVFEHLTAAAFIEFARRQVDVAVVETGLGGKLDATIVVRPLLSVMTPIGLDHILVLGNSIGLIAADKAHIIKAGVPAISSPQSLDARSQLVARAKEVGAPLEFAPGADEFEIESLTISGSRLRSTRRWLRDSSLQLALPGRFQLVNLSTVLTTVERLRAAGFKIGAEAVERGAAAVRWPGRLQAIGRRPLIILDGAHNPLAIEALCRSLTELLPVVRAYVVFSAIGGKPLEEMLGILGGIAIEVHLAPLHFPKGVTMEGLTAAAEAVGLKYACHSDVPAALDAARGRAGTKGVVLATGSLYLVGEVMRHRRRLPPPPGDGGIDAGV